MAILRRSLMLAAAGTVAASLQRGNARAAALQPLSSLHPIAPPSPPADIGWETADGTHKTLADYGGRGVVLNLWATWCVPCVAEMPALDELARMVANDGIDVLPLSSDRGGVPVVEKFYAAREIKTLPVLLDPQSAASRALGLRGIPTTLVIDRKGRELGRLEGGAAWDDPAAVTLLRQMLA
jgi:thiol-disulfide isomerase/thioredoxin